VENYQGESEGLMATVRKREGKKGVSWQIDYFDPNGKRVRESFKKKKDAEAELGKRVSLIAEKRYLDVKKDYTTTLKDLIDEYTRTFGHQPSFKTAKSYFLDNFKGFWGEDTLLSQITTREIDRYITHLKLKPTMHKTLRKPATVNREIDCLRQMLKKATVWGMMEVSPFDKLDSRRLRENNRKERYLTKAEILRLLPECPAHLRPIVETALHAGLRQGEVLGLRWRDVDFKRERLFVEKAEDNLTKPGGWVDTNEDLTELLKKLRPKDMIAPDAYVFTFNGNRIESVKTAFNAALKRAGIEGASFHTLRHTCASHMAMAGCTPQEIAAQLRHHDVRTSMRYMHLSPKHKKKAASTLVGLTASENCHKLSQIEEVACSEVCK
jgi:integrase